MAVALAEVAHASGASPSPQNRSGRDWPPRLVPPPSEQFTPAGQVALAQLVASVRAGALGSDVEEATFNYMSKSFAPGGALRFQLLLKDGRREGFYFLRPLSSQPTGGANVSVLPDDDVPGQRVDQLRRAVASVFTADPWDRDPYWTPENNWQSVRPPRILFAIAYVGVTTFLGVLFLLLCGRSVIRTVR
jgi:hypothetical protein